jgi:hypothetical protein
LWKPALPIAKHANFLQRHAREQNEFGLAVLAFGALLRSLDLNPVAEESMQSALESVACAADDWQSTVRLNHHNSPAPPCTLVGIRAELDEGPKHASLVQHCVEIAAVAAHVAHQVCCACTYSCSSERSTHSAAANQHVVCCDLACTLSTTQGCIT